MRHGVESCHCGNLHLGVARLVKRRLCHWRSGSRRHCSGRLVDRRLRLRSRRLNWRFWNCCLRLWWSWDSGLGGLARLTHKTAIEPFPLWLHWFLYWGRCLLKHRGFRQGLADLSLLSHQVIGLYQGTRLRLESRTDFLSDVWLLYLSREIFGKLFERRELDTDSGDYSYGWVQ